MELTFRTLNANEIEDKDLLEFRANVTIDTHSRKH